MQCKILILGIDGADWEILNPLIQQGKLPFLAKVKKTGIYANLISTIPSISAPAWASFQTGVSPAKHGVFDFEDIVYQKIHKTSPKKLIDSRSVKGAKFWDYLEQAGLQGCFINLPLTYPFPTRLPARQATNSILVSSLLTPTNEVYSNNKEVYRQLKQMDYIVDVAPLTKTLSEEKSFAQRNKTFHNVLKMTQARKAAALKLINKNFDVFFCLFRGSDVLQHLFLGEEEIEKYYRQLDKTLGEIYKYHNTLFQDNTLTFIISDHGFHQKPRYKLHLVNWLIEQGYLAKKPSEPRTLTLFRPLYRPIKSLIERGSLKVTAIKFKDMVWGKTLQQTSQEFFRSSTISAVHFGIYCPSSQKKKISSQLKQLTYQKKKVFQLVYAKEEIYQGKYAQFLPDILFVPTEDFAIDPFPLREKVFTFNASPLRGDHRSTREGIFLGIGKELARGKITDLHIEDILPTSLFILDQALPQNLDGKVRKAIFRQSSQLAKRKVKFTDKPLYPDRTVTEKTVSNKDQEQIKEKLRNLGYF